MFPTVNRLSNLPASIPSGSNIFIIEVVFPDYGLPTSTITKLPYNGVMWIYLSSVLNPQTLYRLLKGFEYVLAPIQQAKLPVHRIEQIIVILSSSNAFSLILEVVSIHKLLAALPTK